MAFPATASAAPVYLDCQWTNAARTVHDKLVLDEIRHRASVIVLETGNVTENIPALFLPSEVIIQEPADGAVRFTYVINRVTLAFEFRWEVGSKQWKNTGTCAIAPTPARKF